MTLAIIPARGGSKRIPRKNIKSFHGRPVISFAIDAAIKSNLFKHVIVSTDDYEIADIAKQCGAEVPIMRPLELSDDFSTTIDVMNWAVNAYEKIGIKTDYTCCIYPVNPLLNPQDLQNAFKIIKAKGANYSFPVAQFPSNIERALQIDNNFLLTSINKSFESIRTQDLEQNYYDAGQFYWGKNSAWQAKCAIRDNSVGIILPSWRVVDIDDESDWKRAELAYQFLLKEKDESF